MKTVTPYERKAVRLLDLKVDEASGAFEGIASVYGNTDLGGDIVEKGAFTRSIKARGNEIPILWSHNAAMPVGLGTVTDSPKGLLVSGQFDLDTHMAREVYSWLKKRIIKGLSIGYKSIPAQTVLEGGFRRLKEVILYEVSLVAFPMNEQALVTAVKAEGVEEDELEFYAALDVNELADALVEAKAGRTISQATRQRIEDAIARLQALLVTESADTGTSDTPGPAEQHSDDPDRIHSWLKILDQKIQEITV